MKSWYKSKTVWFNVLAGVVMIATMFGYTGEMSPEVSDKVNAFMPMITIIVNLILRKFTDKPIGA
ncbi:hypothetical protein [Thiocapsa sp. N5-Cardenillas]|uniref:hypothetical protein n=1 Tax=Thiocapsa sp. N5-Cardenillas TaxID=3137397 RepID=UPI0035B0F6B5